MTDMIGRLIAMERDIEELKRRLEATVRVGRVTEVDAENGLAKIDVGTPENPLVTGWVPWAERAGAIKTWTPPSEGEQVRLISPAGDMAQGWVDHGGFSNQQAQPHDKGGEHRRTVGDTTITETGGQVLIQTPDILVECETATIQATEVKLGGDGGKPVARIGDRVNVPIGSSKGKWPIIEGSGVVNAVD